MENNVSVKVIFCSPFHQGDGYIQGGMAVWGAIIVNHYRSLSSSDVILIPISFDRKSYIVNKETNFFKRFVKGVIELWHPISLAIKNFRDNNVKAVHICSSGSLSLIKDYLLIIAAKRHNVKSIIHFHMGRIPAIIDKGGWEKRLLLLVMKKADVIAVMDTLTYDRLLNMGYTKVTNIPNPLSKETTGTVESYSNKIQRFSNRVFYAGHVVKTKGVYELVEACSTINNLELRIAGRCTSEIKNELRKIWEGSSNSGQLSFLGEIPHVEVIKEMLSASCFALPSYTEGFPNVIIEAMACGCPIIATRVGAIPKMIDEFGEQKSGICVTARDIISLKNGIAVLLNDVKLSSKLSYNARARVFSHYSMDRIWNLLTDLWINYTGDIPVSYI